MSKDKNDIPNIPAAPEAPEAPEAPVAPEAPEAPEAPGAPEAPEAPGVGAPRVKQQKSEKREDRRVIHQRERRKTAEAIRVDWIGKNSKEIGIEISNAEVSYKKADRASVELRDAIKQLEKDRAVSEKSISDGEKKLKDLEEISKLLKGQEQFREKMQKIEIQIKQKSEDITKAREKMTEIDKTLPAKKSALEDAEEEAAIQKVKLDTLKQLHGQAVRREEREKAGAAQEDVVPKASAPAAKMRIMTDFNRDYAKYGQLAYYQYDKDGNPSNDPLGLLKVNIWIEAEKRHETSIQMAIDKEIETEARRIELDYKERLEALRVKSGKSDALQGDKNAYQEAQQNFPAKQQADISAAEARIRKDYKPPSKEPQLLEDTELRRELEGQISMANISQAMLTAWVGFDIVEAATRRSAENFNKGSTENSKSKYYDVDMTGQQSKVPREALGRFFMESLHVKPADVQNNFTQVLKSSLEAGTLNQRMINKIVGEALNDANYDIAKVIVLVQAKEVEAKRLAEEEKRAAEAKRQEEARRQQEAAENLAPEKMDVDEEAQDEMVKPKRQESISTPTSPSGVRSRASSMSLASPSGGSRRPSKDATSEDEISVLKGREQALVAEIDKLKIEIAQLKETIKASATKKFDVSVEQLQKRKPEIVAEDPFESVLEALEHYADGFIEAQAAGKLHAGYSFLGVKIKSDQVTKLDIAQRAIEMLKNTESLRIDAVDELINEHIKAHGRLHTKGRLAPILERLRDAVVERDKFRPDRPSSSA